jgi:hypothetical protein
MRSVKSIVISGAVMLLAGCAVQPTGPSIRVLPAPYKPFEVYQHDVDECEGYASDRTRGAAERANNRAVGAAVIGTALGLGIGAATGDGHAAAAGAAIGGAAGTAVGASESDQANYGLQRRYDNAFAECMYARGNQVPGYYGPAGPPPPPPPGRQPPPPPPPRG